MKKKEKITQLEKYNKDKNTLKKIKNPYSLKNNKANNKLLNSKLYPLTNSLSPSLKSNGGRFNSTKIIITNKGKINKFSRLKTPITINLCEKIIKQYKTKKNTTSKEILWLLDRIAPNIEYLDFL